MARSPQLVLSTTLAIAPTGWALPSNDPGSNWGKFLFPLASAWSDVETSVESLLAQVDPRAATTLLPLWLALFPDPCGRNIQSLPLSEQQQYCYQRLTATGGGSPAYFISLAASLGITATIQQGGVSVAGLLQAGQPLEAPTDCFNWQVTLPPTQATIFTAGDSAAGDSLGSFTASPAVCPITHASPAHTTVVFSYTG